MSALNTATILDYIELLGGLFFAGCGSYWIFCTTDGGLTGEMQLCSCSEWSCWVFLE
jgi:hypothetical protein